jgi:hypothetical protein
MAKIPAVVQQLLDEWRREFSPSVGERFLAMIVVVLLLRGRRSVLRLYPFRLVPGHWSSLHRVFSQRRWRAMGLARILARTLVQALAPQGALQLCGDDTVSQHRGEQVYGKACHRDAVRSSHSHLVHRWGHKWVVLALRVQVPGTRRTGALPVLVALYRAPQANAQEGRRHKTPADLMQGLLAVWIRWFPQRKSLFAGAGAYGTHHLARFARRHHRRLAVVSKFYPDAVLHQPPPRRRPGQQGRPRVRGERLPTPAETVATAKRWRTLKVSWYGGGQRSIAAVSRVGHWYRQGHGLVKLRWVYVRDRTGTHCDECLMTTDESLSIEEVVGSYVGRWDIEVMYEELREHLGLETTRGRSQQTVLPVEPCLFGLYSLVALWFAWQKRERRPSLLVAWPGKHFITFSDALASVRCDAWGLYLNQTTWLRSVVHKLRPRQRNDLIQALALAG